LLAKLAAPSQRGIGKEQSGLDRRPGHSDNEDERPILHSDQGCQDQMSALQHRLEARDLAQSMSRKGNCLDNAPMESFFATLKSELFHPERFETVQNLDTAIKHYIDYYNHRRIKLKGLAPVQYRNQP
jgi:putative transposase